MTQNSNSIFSSKKPEIPVDRNDIRHDHAGQGIMNEYPNSIQHFKIIITKYERDSLKQMIGQLKRSGPRIMYISKHGNPEMSTIANMIMNKQFLGTKGTFKCGRNEYKN
jgi:hypothetical protein